MQRRHFAAALPLTAVSAVWAQAPALAPSVAPSLAASPAPAQVPSQVPSQIQLAGVMGGKALLVIDGQTQMLAVGTSARGVKLLSVQGDTAEVQRSGGGALSLRVGASPVALGPAVAKGPSAREIVLTAGPGGHFITGGAINGQAVSFLVDTGATAVAMSQTDAARIGLDLRNGQRGLSSTANGTVPVVLVTLSSVRVGEIEVPNVQAVVVPAQMPHVLLGNSFLTRFQMRRENDVMRLELRR